MIDRASSHAAAAPQPHVMGQGSFQRRVRARLLREQAMARHTLQGSSVVERRSHTAEAADSISAPAPISRP